MVRFTTPTLLTVLLVLGLSMGASAADIDPTVPSVALGSDYFATQPGTHFNFGGGIGDVNLLGLADRSVQYRHNPSSAKPMRYLAARPYRFRW